MDKELERLLNDYRKEIEDRMRTIAIGGPMAVADLRVENAKQEICKLFGKKPA